LEIANSKMMKPLIGSEVAEKIGEQLPGAVVEYNDTSVLVKSESIFDACRLLYQTAGLDFDYLVNLTGVDYLDYLEVVYHLVSMKHNHSLVLKTRCYDREQPTVPSVVSVWKGADFQEREVYDLLGIRFDGHPNMKRIFLWEGFQGHPLRRDYL
jgi:NADH-quinone oxidoreductase subunit C